MPELPEVEHTAGRLRAWLVGQTVVRAQAPRTRVFRDEAARRAFEARLVGRALCAVDRRGKYLLLTFDGGVGALAHLGMSGRFVRAASEAEGASVPHVRARLSLADGSVVAYRDPRMFGRIAVYDAAALEALPEVAGLGPDPLRDGVDPARLCAAFARTRRPVKVALMDGAVLAGVGNIQATEALWRARVHPARPAASLSRAEGRALARGVEATIRFTLDDLARTTPPDAPVAYVNDDACENPFLVYGRAGEACPRRGCDGVLASILLGGRTSAFCPTCQR